MTPPNDQNHAVEEDGPFQDVLLEIRGLRTYVASSGQIGRAVDGVWLDAHRGETLGIVGESGSGKSLTALSIMRLHGENAEVVGGQILYEGTDLLKLSDDQMRAFRGARIGYIPQDPMSSLNPVISVGKQIAEPLRWHLGLRGKEARARAIELMEMVHIPEAGTRFDSFPHEFSGGMRQRVVGAIALGGQPDLLIADEPTTSLDVTIQSAYLKLLRELQRKNNLTIIFITHDFGIVANLCDRVAVMYAGRVVEVGPTDTVLLSPAHPYTQALLEALPDVAERTQRLKTIGGQPPSIFRDAVGCSFAPRCKFRMDICEQEDPSDVALGSNHRASCFAIGPY